MTPFGFTPDDGQSDDENNREHLEAMMRQMQEQIQQQFQQLGINGFGSGIPGFSNAPAEILPLATVRETARKFAATQGSQPLGTKDVTAITSACELADIWLNEATVFPANSSPAPRSTSRLDWVDLTLKGWHSTMEPLAAGLTSAISRLLEDATGSENEGQPIPIEAIAGLLRTFIGSMIATQLGQAIGAISTSAIGAHDAGLPVLEPAYPLLIAENIEAWGA